MKEKLRRLLEAEQIKPGLLAEQLGMNPSGISHLLAGRNKPGFELLQKLLLRFPNLNPDWLLLDAPNMYRTETKDTPRTIIQTQPDRPAPSESEPATSTSQSQPAARTPQPELEFPLPPISSQKAAIEKIVVFYDDRTFDVYAPTQS